MQTPETLPGERRAHWCRLSRTHSPARDASRMRVRQPSALLLIALSAALLIGAGPSVAAGQSAAALGERGVETYQVAQQSNDGAARRAAFLRAARLFQQAAAAAPGRASPALLTNTGTAFLQAGETGEAMLYFHRALALDPDHERALRAVAEVRATLPVSVPVPRTVRNDSLFGWHERATNSDRKTVMLVSFALFCAAFTASLMLGSAALRWLSLPPALTFTATALALIVALRADPVVDAVVTAPEVVARTADSFNSAPRYSAPLPAGTEVVVIEERARWRRVRLANDDIAWLPARSVRRVLEPGRSSP
ncbi:MAG: hypothetical protein AAF458_10615 [Pseudomonadota bacterium]